MKKTAYPFSLKAIVAITVLMALLTSCLSDDLTVDEEPGIIVVSLDGVTTRAAGDPLFTGDEAIDKVRVFVFAGEYVEKNKFYASGNSDFVNPFVLEVATGNKEVYVVANESNALTPVLESITTKTGLMEILGDQISAPLTLPLLMTGKSVGVSVANIEDPLRNNTSVTLTRVAAKISLTLKKDTDAEVKITRVSLLNNTEKTAIWAGGASISDQTYWNWTHALPTAIDLSTTATAISGYENIYVYENLTGGVKSHATQLEVEALYNNVPTKYRVYLNENVSSVINAGDPSSSVTTPGDHLYSLKRNHAYQLIGTVKNIGEFDGLTILSRVLPWNYLPSSLLFDRTFTLFPKPTSNNFTYSVNENGKISFTFKLTNPIDATWVANLTNPTDFEFEGIYQGGRNDEVTLTVKATNFPGAEERTTEFYINVLYGGNSSEIPLLSGSPLVGPGNRVLIKQSANP
jgi:hypothetical protein